MTIDKYMQQAYLNIFGTTYVRHALHEPLLCNMLDQLKLNFEIIEQTLAGPDEFQTPFMACA